MCARLVDVEGELRLDRPAEALGGNAQGVRSRHYIDEDVVAVGICLHVSLSLGSYVGQGHGGTRDHRLAGIGNRAIDRTVGRLAVRSAASEAQHCHKRHAVAQTNCHLSTPFIRQDIHGKQASSWTHPQQRHRADDKINALTRRRTLLPF